MQFDIFTDNFVFPTFNTIPAIQLTDMSSVFPDDFNSILPNFYKDDLVSLCFEQIRYVDNLRSTILSTLISVTAEAGTDYKTGFTTLVSSVPKLVESDILNSRINNSKACS
jgi:hypothetical protein